MEPATTQGLRAPHLPTTAKEAGLWVLSRQLKSCAVERCPLPTSYDTWRFQSLIVISGVPAAVTGLVCTSGQAVPAVPITSKWFLIKLRFMGKVGSSLIDILRKRRGCLTCIGERARNMCC